MLRDFIRKISPELRKDFVNHVRFALDGSYRKLKIINKILIYGYDINYVIKSDEQKMCRLPNGLKLKFKQCEQWIKENLIFRDFNDKHGFSVLFFEKNVELIDKSKNKLIVNYYYEDSKVQNLRNIVMFFY